jgi:cytoplasmic iron level regulating protein YaaA (DUF328/UPF0246 family)
MTIFFSPSEGKTSHPTHSEINRAHLRHESLCEFQRPLLETYNRLINSGDEKTIQELTGLKKPKDYEAYCHDIFNAPTQKAVTLYSGVGYEYLDYGSLDESAQSYVDNRVLIYSNLFGVVHADDPIPNYKLKQSYPLDGLKIEKYYHDNMSSYLDEVLKDEEILDLRAGVYEKFYTIKTPYIYLKFYKEGKVVSHWAKAYRGLVLRAVAQAGVNSLEEFMNLEIKGLKVRAIKEVKNKRTIEYDITE